MGHLWRGQALQPHGHAAYPERVPIGDTGAANQALTSAGGQADGEQQGSNQSEHSAGLAQPMRETPPRPI